MRKRNYMFTNRTQSIKGIMATILGVISMGAVLLAVGLAYLQHGETPLNYGLSMILALAFSLAGLTIAIVSRTEKDRFYLFSYLGMFFNTLDIAMIGYLLYAGVHGI